MCIEIQHAAAGTRPASRRRSIAALALAGAIGACQAWADDLPSSDALSARLDVDAASGHVSLSITNRSSRAIGILRDGSAFEPTLASDVFSIRERAKQWPLPEPLSYTGALAQRRPPTPADVVRLEPGQTLVSPSIELGDVYDVSLAAHYRVAYTGTLDVVPVPADTRSRQSVAAWQPRPVALGAATVDIPLQPSTGLTLRAQTPVFSQCDANQQGFLDEATVLAESQANESFQSLDGTAEADRPTSPRYTYWFGAYDEQRYAYATGVFRRMADRLTNEPLTYVCGCPGFDANVIAYVMPFQSEDVTFCPLFFDPRFSDIERGSTIVHELSHLRTIGATDDFTYGADATAARAATSPGQAITNASSYDKFASNFQPELAMVGDGPPPPPESDDVPSGDETSADAFETLQVGNPVQGTVAVDELALYQVSGAESVTVESLSGDADLYIFDDTELTTETLVCAAEEYSETSRIDSCRLPSDNTYYIAVSGFTAAEYVLTAAAGEGGGAGVEDEPEAVRPQDIGSGQSVDGTIAEQAQIVYTVPAPALATLTSRSGDADLYVFSDPSLSAETLVCRSELPAVAVDLCELTGNGPRYAVVYGTVESTDYTLAIGDLPATGTTGDTGGDTGGDTTGGTGGDTTGGTDGDTTGGTEGDTTGSTTGDATGGTGGDMTGETGGASPGDPAGGGQTGGPIGAPTDGPAEDPANTGGSSSGGGAAGPVLSLMLALLTGLRRARRRN